MATQQAIEQEALEIERESDAIVQQIRPLLAGRSAHQVGWILCELLATWVACHRAGDQTEEFRQDLLEAHIESVKELIPVMDKQIASQPDLPYVALS